MYYAQERGAQPDQFPRIPWAMWWSIITLTTISDGDLFPVTGFDKGIAGGGTTILDIGLFTLPASILGSGFLEE